ncbi:uncharacterized protein BDZ99DRAFT_571519 [Mytilinidion resinicola]|uniref:Zn(2)-C6 fungal-type domain-containing protein n=1 Tax=Mytilinidion resinicola TaxID=574789 RepID=A0A6A6YMH7_9PEZI|nr:uncharacterized protein BDZ99DRAFT_571519 [Mytilinidion resinicola]KAF2809759.1 hypothetical protein BDZ99DRAFT_571519 [Mytilinidion resinicola]
MATRPRWPRKTLAPVLRVSATRPYVLVAASIDDAPPEEVHQCNEFSFTSARSRERRAQPVVFAAAHFASQGRGRKRRLMLAWRARADVERSRQLLVSSITQHLHYLKYTLRSPYQHPHFGDTEAMSYRGRPSKGCQMCRTRKVKCDEAKPTCSRCQKTGHECQYRDQSDLLFRNQTAIAAQKAEDGWRKRATKSASHSSKSSESPPTADSISTLTSVAQHLSLNRQPSDDLQDLAYSRWLYDFVVPSSSTDPGIISDGVLDFVPMYENAAPDSCLRAATLATCYANFYGRFKSAEAKLRSSEYCGKALKLMQAAIKDPVESKSDETLLTVYLLGVWENLTADTYNGHWLVHKSGAVALLRFRKPEEYHTPVASRLFDLVYAQMLMGNLNTCEEPPAGLDHWADSVHTYKMRITGITHSTIRLSKVIHSVVSIWSKWRRHVAMPAGTSSHSIDPLQLLMEANELDIAFQTWEEENLPDDWKFQILENRASIYGQYDTKWVDMLLKSEGAPLEVHVYDSLKIIFGWNLYRTARLFLNIAMHEIIGVLMLSSPTGASPAIDPVLLDRSHIECQMSRMVKDVCASVLPQFTVIIRTKEDSSSASNVCGLRGYYLLWPLAVTSQVLISDSLVGIDPKRLEWIQNVLIYLKNDLGITKASAAVKAISLFLERGPQGYRRSNFW